MSIGEWIVLAIACGVGISGLLLAASQGEGATYSMGLLMFGAAVVYAFYFLKRHFDRIDQAPH
jgi:hypothetical protein